MCSNKFESSSISIPSPFKQNSIINISISKRAAPIIDVNLVNSTPYIKCTIFLDGIVSSLGKEVDLSSQDNLDLISDYSCSFIKEQMKEYLYKTSKQLHSDIDNFGSKLLFSYLTTEEFEKINWLELYKDSYFDISVICNVKGSYLVVKN